MNLHEQVLADSERTLGPHHPDTLQTRHSLAVSYWQAGRTQDAINLHEQVLTERERTLGPEHPDTLTTRHSLAVSYWQAGRTQDAINLQEQVLGRPGASLCPRVLRTTPTAGVGCGRRCRWRGSGSVSGQ
ncbi:tetratricopeptide repeat protein [Streptomyces sp. enrichment culture]|uniref:tetratricopeptide repeat protein n=1 Tax=Streptomyces sp. enrichment culture TaxID=1795815 RepID=UPI003F56066C